MALWSSYLPPPLSKARGQFQPPGAVSPCPSGPHSRESSAPYRPALPGYGHTKPGPPTQGDRGLPGGLVCPCPQGDAGWGCPGIPGCPVPGWDAGWALAAEPCPAQSHGVRALLPLPREQQARPAPWHCPCGEVSHGTSGDHFLLARLVRARC